MAFKHTLKDGTVLQLPTSTLSYTQVSMWLKCPQQYKQRYVDGIKTPPGVALVEGSAAHAGVEANNNTKIDTGEDMEAKEVVEIASEYFLDHKSEIEDWTEAGDTTDVDTVLKRAAKYLGVYMRDHARLVQPVAAEEEFTLDVGGIPLVAYVDLRTKTGLLDYKTVTSKSQVFRDLDKSLQLAIYGHAAKTRNVGYIGFLKDTGGVKTVETVLHPNAWNPVEQTIIQVAKAISAGCFPMCDATSWACSPKFCGYWNRCRGALLAGTWPNPVADRPKGPLRITVPGVPQGRKAPPKRALA
jgi:hypothetical protein